MEDGDTSNLTELFRTNTLDTRIESALPILSRLNLTITETNEASMFEAWADSLIGEALIPNQPLQKEELIDLLGSDSDIIPLGPDASNAIGELSGILEKDGLNARLMKAASLDSNRDARPIIIAWMSEQLGREYDEILDKVQSTDEEPVISEPEESPVKQQKTAQAPTTDNIPPPPPVKEAMSLLDHIKRLSGI